MPVFPRATVNDTRRTGTIDPSPRDGRGVWASPFFDSATAAGLIMVAAGATFVVLRVALVAHGRISDFIEVGSIYSDPSRLPRGIHVFPGTGYDGQFFYRLALDPANLGQTAHGITFDASYRLERIGYPFLAWLTAAGQESAVPYTLVAVNLAGLGLLGLLGGSLAKASGRRAMWGLLIAGYFGFILTLGRDLAEICAVVFVLAGLLAMRRQRPVLAGLAFAAAVVTREDALVVVVAVAIVAVLRWAREAWASNQRQQEAGQGAALRATLLDRRSRLAQVPWALPLAAFAAWQLVIRIVADQQSGSGDVGSNLSLPFSAPLNALRHYVGGLPGTSSLFWCGELAVLVIVMAFAAWNFFSTSAEAHERLGWLLAAALGVSLNAATWLGEDFRSFSFLWILGTLILVGSRRNLAVPAVLAGVSWLVVAIHLLAFF